MITKRYIVQRTYFYFLPSLLFLFLEINVKLFYDPVWYRIGDIYANESRDNSQSPKTYTIYRYQQITIFRMFFYWRSYNSIILSTFLLQKQFMKEIFRVIIKLVVLITFKTYRDGFWKCSKNISTILIIPCLQDLEKMFPVRHISILNVGKWLKLSMVLISSLEWVPIV